ncbi:hypothetical protein EVJ58_g7615 [Rhodofomes roseus]|uniref:Uncharacterized protein n=1 Tax=Rhodofomes roseus TaxID=34475 RepID=A0A4Y9Y2K3_9APHY|nr:hypothetical protein EVJ58_g7615 [Rhodofomes roseus]
MQAMKQMQYPDVHADSSIFEDEEDYQAVLGATRGKVTLARTADMPARLLARGKYEEAERLLDEMRDMRLQPASSPVFVDAAIHVLRTRWTTLHARRAAFQRFYSYIPFATSNHPSFDQAARVLELLLQNIIDLPLMKLCILTNVARGYFLMRHVAIVRDYVRLSDPHSSVRLLDALYDKSVEGLKTMARFGNLRVSSNRPIHPLIQDAEPRVNVMLQATYSTAILEFCKQNRADLAVAVLQKAWQRDIPVHALVYSRVINKLESALDTENLSLVKQLIGDRPADSTFTPYLPSADFLKPPPPAHLPDDRPLNTRSRLADALRILRRHISAYTCPEPSVLANVFAACAHFQCPRILTILRERAYRKTDTAMVWALAEMLYHHKRRDVHAISLVFRNNFRMIGVPPQAYFYASFYRRGPRWDDSSLSTSKLYTHATLPSDGYKMWPSTHHTVLVWRACAEKVVHAASLTKLYKELLAQVKASRQVHSLVHSPSPPNIAQERHDTAQDVRLGSVESAGAESPYPTPTPPPYMYDDAHFNVFVREFGKTDTAAAARVISDMYQLGVQPGVETLSLLLCCFSEQEEESKMIQLLERMEATLDAEAAHGDSATSASNDLVLPPPNVAAYVTVIEHLMVHQQPVVASGIALRMFNKLQYQFGTKTQMDRLLLTLVHALAALKRERKMQNTQMEQSEHDTVAAFVAALRQAQKRQHQRPRINVSEPSTQP